MDTLTPASETAADFPGMLRYWRARRGYSQLALSLAAGVSQRHISFLESGRARPSRAMILALAEQLNVPLRQRNRLLLAAGFAPAYTEHDLGEPPLQMVNQAVALILAKQEPYPAVVLDRFWNLIDANRAYRRMLALLLDGRQAATLADGKRVNLMLAVFDPEGLWPLIGNAPQVGRYLLRRVWQELQAQAYDRTAHEILARIAAWHPDMLGPGGVPQRDSEGGAETAPLQPVLPVTLVAPNFSATLFSTLTTLGNVHDVTLQELRIESFFPADDASRRLLEDLAAAERPSARTEGGCAVVAGNEGQKR